ncbi:MAG: galactokinase, partial [Flavobacteriaceae bacterium]|nr:galactokinase [Flavobacteriaceae bacterium]
MSLVTEISSKAPGRICLFGDHQDYLGLPIIACAINRFVEIQAVQNDSEEFHLKMPDIKTSRRFHMHESFDHLEKGDHIASVVRVVKRYGCVLNKGYTVTIKGEVPINAGLSSSSAVVVAWTRFLLAAFGCTHEITDQLVAQISYEAEVIEHNSPGGRMDQYAIAIGGIIFLQTDDSAIYKKIESPLEGLIIGESGIPKNTVGLLGDLKEKALRSIEVVENYDSNFNLHSATLTDIEKYSDILSEELKPFFYSSIKNHVITQEAFIALNEKVLDYQKIGELMNEHHSVLKNILKITTPKIDNMIDAALKAGAYGAKIVG